MSEDVFEPTRRQVRSLQKLRTKQIEHFDKAQRAMLEMVQGGTVHHTDYSVYCRRLRTEIDRTEYRILQMKSRLPPWAEVRDGVVWLKPVHGPLLADEPV